MKYLSLIHITKKILENLKILGSTNRATTQTSKEKQEI